MDKIDSPGLICTMYAILSGRVPLSNKPFTPQMPLGIAPHLTSKIIWR